MDRKSGLSRAVPSTAVTPVQELSPPQQVDLMMLKSQLQQTNRLKTSIQNAIKALSNGKREELTKNLLPFMSKDVMYSEIILPVAGVLPQTVSEVITDALKTPAMQ